MASIETLAIRLVADIADFESKMNAADGKIDSFSSKMQAAGSKMAGFGAGLTAGVTAPIVGMAIKVADAASDLNESMNKVDVVFGDSAVAVQKWADGSAKAFGQSKQDALEGVGTFGNLFTEMGMGVDKSADMSQSLVVLASDLASFNNIDPTIALEKLRAGITGETEPLRTLGVNLTAATVEAKAMQMGLVEASVDMGKLSIATDRVAIAQQKAAEALAKHGAESTQYKSAALAVETAQRGVEKAMEGSKVELDAATKAQASYALIMEQTTTAQGDFARTSDGLANMTRIVKAQFEDAAASLGQQLLPYALKAVQYISDLIAQFQGLSPETQKWILIIAGAAAAIGPVLVVLGTLISSIGAIIGAFAALPAVAAGAGAAIAAIAGPIGIVLAILGVLYLAWQNDWGGIRQIAEQAWNAIKAAAPDAMNAVKAAVETGMAVVKGIFTAVGAALRGDWQGAWNAIKSTTEAAINGVRSVINNVLRAISTATGADLSAIRALFDVAFTAIQTAVRVAMDIIAGIIKVAAALLRGDFSGAWEAVKQTVVNVVNSIKNAFNIDWGSLARGIIDGIVRGLSNGASAIADAAKNAANAALNAAKSALGIASPSKAGDAIGENFTLSMSSGAKRGIAKLSAVVLGGINGAIGDINPRVSLAGAGGTSGGNNVTINVPIAFYGNPDRREVAAGVGSGIDDILDGLRRVGLR